MSAGFTILIIIFIILFMAGFIGMCYFIYFVIRKSTEKKSEAFIHNEQTMMKRWLMEKKKKLVPWEGHDFTAIGSRMQYSYSKTTKRKFKGVMLNKANKPIIAFYRLERGFQENGYMFASSSQFDIAYDLMNQSYKINFDNKLLGTISKEGEILDGNSQRIGYAKHPIKWNINVPFYAHRGGDNLYEVRLNDRLLANVEVAPDLKNMNSHNIGLSNENLGYQFIRLVDKNYTEEEEKWLTAIAILEGVVHGYWMV